MVEAQNRGRVPRAIGISALIVNLCAACTHPLTGRYELDAGSLERVLVSGGLGPSNEDEASGRGPQGMDPEEAYFYAEPQRGGYIQLRADGRAEMRAYFFRLTLPDVKWAPHTFFGRWRRTTSDTVRLTFAGPAKALEPSREVDLTLRIEGDSLVLLAAVDAGKPDVEWRYRKVGTPRR